MQLLKVSEFLLGCPGKVAMGQSNRIKSTGSHLGSAGVSFGAYHLGYNRDPRSKHQGVCSQRLKVIDGQKGMHSISWILSFLQSVNLIWLHVQLAGVQVVPIGKEVRLGYSHPSQDGMASNWGEVKSKGGALVTAGLKVRPD